MSKNVSSLLKSGLNASRRPILVSAVRNFSASNDNHLSLSGKNDFRSIKEALNSHHRDKKSGMMGDYVPPETMKRFLSEDPKTIATLKKTLKNSNLPKESQDFLEYHLLNQPDDEEEYYDVIFVDIGEYPEYSKQLDKAQQNNTDGGIITVGGPAASDAAIFASIIDGIKDLADDNISHFNRSFLESNIWHSALQNHNRHGNALNASDDQTGHALLSTFLDRAIRGVTRKEITDPNFLKIDLDLFNLNAKRLEIYLGNELNWAKQSFYKAMEWETEHDVSRQVSELSTDLLHILEKGIGKELSANSGKKKEETVSIHVCLTDHEIEEVIEENKEIFKGSGIKSARLTDEELKYFFPDNPNIKAAFKYFGDTHTLFDYHKTVENAAKSKGALWEEGSQITHILTDKDAKGKVKFVGVAMQDINTKESKFTPGSHLLFSGGYKANFKYGKSCDDSIKNNIKNYLDIRQPLPNKIDTATGCSITAIFKNSDRLQKLITNHGTTPQFAVTNSHWTMIANDNEHIIMRVTGGGNIASREYQSHYFENLMANTRRIFGDDLIGVASTYGCPRAINSKNLTETTKVVEGVLISYGKGGTGNTKRHTEAIFALMELGFEKEVVDYLNQHQNDRGEKLGDKALILSQKQKDHGLFHDMTDRTNDRLGYDSKEPSTSMAANSVEQVKDNDISKGKS